MDVNNDRVKEISQTSFPGLHPPVRSQVSRSGLFEVVRDDGSIVNEMRPIEEVAKLVDDRQMENIPVLRKRIDTTNPVDTTNPEKICKLAIGFAINATMDLEGRVFMDVWIRGEDLETVRSGIRKIKLCCLVDIFEEEFKEEGCKARVQRNLEPLYLYLERV